MISFYDTHAHLDYKDFNGEIPQLLDRAEKAGIDRIISVGTEHESSLRNIDLAREYKGRVFAVAGWHPNDVPETTLDIREPLRRFADCEEVVALGETGLDYFRLPTSSDPDEAERIKQRQKDYFHQHLEVAAETGLNLVIHQRSAMEDTLEIFRPFADKVRAVFHCFVDGPDVLEKVLSLGSLVSFTGIITFKTAEAARASVQAVPDDRYMLETDSPFLAPVPHRGKRCEPAYVKWISERVQEIRDQELSVIAHNTNSTARSFFRNLQ